VTVEPPTEKNSVSSGDVRLYEDNPPLDPSKVSVVE